MDILIGIVLVLLACKLLIELFGFFVGIKIVKKITGDWDNDKPKEYDESIYLICIGYYNPNSCRRIA